jgi:hypothetical protein
MYFTPLELVLALFNRGSNGLAQAGYLIGPQLRTTPTKRPVCPAPAESEPELRARKTERTWNVAHTQLDRDRYTITRIVRARCFESNETWRARQNADPTSRHPASAELGQPAIVAAQPELGLLPKRRLGPGGDHFARFITARKNLTLVTLTVLPSTQSSLPGGNSQVSSRSRLLLSQDCKTKTTGAASLDVKPAERKEPNARITTGTEDPA